jgi:serine protease
VADYSDTGTGLDLVAPGGGFDAYLRDDPNCHPDAAPGGDIYQMTFTGSVRRFGLPRDYVGTSMAAPHVSATAALVIASGVLGPHPSPDAILRRLQDTARDLGEPGWDPIYGAGLVDAGAATAP